MTAVLLVAALALFVAGRPVVATTTTTGCAGLDNVQQQIHTPVPLAVCEALEKYVVVHREAADDSPVLCHGGLHDRLRGVYFFVLAVRFDGDQAQRRQLARAQVHLATAAGAKPVAWSWRH